MKHPKHNAGTIMDAGAYLFRALDTVESTAHQTGFDEEAVLKAIFNIDRASSYLSSARNSLHQLLRNNRESIKAKAKKSSMFTMVTSNLMPEGHYHIVDAEGRFIQGGAIGNGSPVCRFCDERHG